MHPVAHDRPRWRRAGGLHPERRVHVGIHPAAEVEDRSLDGIVFRRQGAETPVRPIVLLAQPFEQPRRRRLQPGEPVRAPRLAADRRIRWHRVHRHLADRVLAELARGDAAPDVVNIGQVAIVRGLDRDDGAQVRWPQLGHLDRGEPAVADPPHSDRAGAPRLGRQPLDGVVPVQRLSLGVFVQRDSTR